MKLLLRNTTLFEYLPYKGAGSDLNEYGEHTGDFSRPCYGCPKTYRGCITAPGGNTNQTFYGEDIRYTHTLIMDRHVGITEYGIVRWRGNLYEVTAVRPTINGESIALRRMTADEGEPYVPDPEPDEGDGEGE